MFKWIGIVLIIFHALIHLLGSDTRQNRRGLERTGLIWYIPFILFILAAVAIAFNEDRWWIIASVALILSQSLIILHWHESRVGTLVNLLIAIFTIIALGNWSFQEKVKKEVVTLFSLPVSEKITPAEFIKKSKDIPKPVMNWFVHSGAIHKRETSFVHVHQQGAMRTTPNDSWLPLQAEQYFTIDKPGFVWSAKVNAVGPLYLVVRDKYENGKGNMLIKFLSVITVSDARGKEMDQGSMVRFLAETPWFPSAALSPYIKWEEVSSLSAKAIITYGDITASGLFTFNDRGDVIGFNSERYMENKGAYTLEKWQITNLQFKELNGIRIPVESEVTWKLKEGDFTWCKLYVTDIDYNAFAEE